MDVVGKRRFSLAVVDIVDIVDIIVVVVDVVVDNKLQLFTGSVPQSHLSTNNYPSLSNS